MDNNTVIRPSQQAALLAEDVRESLKTSLGLIKRYCRLPAADNSIVEDLAILKPTLAHVLALLNAQLD